MIIPVSDAEQGDDTVETEMQRARRETRERKERSRLMKRDLRVCYDVIH